MHFFFDIQNGYCRSKDQNWFCCVQFQVCFCADDDDDDVGNGGDDGFA